MSLPGESGCRFHTPQSRIQGFFLMERILRNKAFQHLDCFLITGKGRGPCRGKAYLIVIVRKGPSQDARIQFATPSQFSVCAQAASPQYRKSVVNGFPEEMSRIATMYGACRYTEVPLEW